MTKADDEGRGRAWQNRVFLKEKPLSSYCVDLNKSRVSIFSSSLRSFSVLEQRWHEKELFNQSAFLLSSAEVCHKNLCVPQRKGQVFLFIHQVMFVVRLGKPWMTSGLRLAPLWCNFFVLCDISKKEISAFSPLRKKRHYSHPLNPVVTFLWD